MPVSFSAFMAFKPLCVHFSNCLCYARAVNKSGCTQGVKGGGGAHSGQKCQFPANAVTTKWQML